MYLRFPGGNSRLGAHSVHVSDGVRDTASLHVSQSACYTLSSQSVLNRKGRLSLDLREFIDSLFVSSVH